MRYISCAYMYIYMRYISYMYNNSIHALTCMIIRYMRYKSYTYNKSSIMCLHVYIHVLHIIYV